MKLVVGLGNPGIRYAGTRHNLGAETVNRLAKDLKISLKKERLIPVCCGQAQIAGECVLLAVPLTYMNVCGHALALLVRRKGIALSDLLVVYDDMDLPVGSLRMRADGSAGGHNGVKSVIEALGSKAFCRLRMGIGRPPQSSSAAERAAEGSVTAEFVLSRFSRAEAAVIKDVVVQACNGVQSWVEHGIEKSMNTFNR